VLHISCHGQKTGLCLEFDHEEVVIRGNPGAVRSHTMCGIDQLKSALSERVQLVFLSACCSNELARELSSCVPYVIGTADDTNDTPARLFSKLFYSKLFERHRTQMFSTESVKGAFFSAQTEIGQEGEKYQLFMDRQLIGKHSSASPILRWPCKTHAGGVQYTKIIPCNNFLDEQLEPLFTLEYPCGQLPNRLYLLDRLYKTLRWDRCRGLVLFGEAGVGKSLFASHLARRFIERDEPAPALHAAIRLDLKHQRCLNDALFCHGNNFDQYFGLRYDSINHSIIGRTIREFIGHLNNKVDSKLVLVVLESVEECLEFQKDQFFKDLTILLNWERVRVRRELSILVHCVLLFIAACGCAGHHDMPFIIPSITPPSLAVA
jgi:hypothetical protein